MFPKNKLERKFRVKRNRGKKMTRELADLCYNIPDGSIYGEITIGSIENLVKKCNLAEISEITLVDIGSGSGYTLCHLAASVKKHFKNIKNIQLLGYEVCEERCKLSNIIMSQLLADVDNVSYKIYHANIAHVKTLSGVQCCFSFDKTFGPKLMKHIEHLQRNTPSIVNVISNHKYPDMYWEKVDAVRGKLRGSKQTMNFYIYRRRRS